MAQPLLITTASLPYGTVGNFYGAQLTSSGGGPLNTWSISAGNLPKGLSLDPNKAVITGTVAAAGTYTFTVKVFDPETQQSATKDLFIGIPQITNGAVLPNAFTAAQYSVTFTASDGPAPYSWTIDVPPPGLVLDQKQGILSGSPSKAGAYTFTITAFGSADRSSATKVFSLAVLSTPTIATASPLPSGDAGSTYKTALSVNGGTPPYRWSIVGSLPAGLSIDGSGTIAGTPTAAGLYNFSVQVSDSAGASSTKPFALTINTPLTIVTTSPLPNGTVGVTYSRTIAASGGMAPYTFSVGPPPPFGQNAPPQGVTLNPNGTLSGFPSVAGTYNFTIVVTDSLGVQSNTPFTLAIGAALAISTASPLAGGVTGVPYSQTITAAGGSPPYSFALVGPSPPGLTLTSAGLLSGTPTAAGTFTFTVSVTDSAQTIVTSQSQITITSQVPPLQTSPSSLSFAALVGGDSPALQSLLILGTAGAPVNFSVQVDAGTANSAAPRWLMVSPIGGTTPGRLVVSVDPDGMAAGTYTGRIRIVPPAGASLPPIDVAVTLTLTAVAPHLDVIPSFIRLTTRVQAPDTLEHFIVIRNSGGGGPISFTASVVGQSAWIVEVVGASGRTRQNSPIFLRVHVDTTGLAVGSYRDVIHIASSAGNVDVPISLFVSGSGAILRLHITGVRFRVKQGSGTTQTQTLNVLNHGDPASTSNWTADLLSGSEWLSFDSSTGTSTFTNPGTLTLLPKGNVSGFAPGAYYALVRVTDPFALGSPQYLTAVLEVAEPQTLPVLEPGRAGLFFTASAGGRPPAGELVRIFTSNTEAVSFQVSTDTNDGAKWLIAAVLTGQASTDSPGRVMVTVNPAGLAPGIYLGHVNIAYPGSLRAVSVTLVVTGATSTSPAGIRAADGCTPSRLALTQTGLPDSFAVPARWPANLGVQLYDQCGAPVPYGSVVASFSNGDPPLTLHDLLTGAYSATWQPGNATAQMTITIRAAAGILEPATMQLVGGISQNRAPVLAKNGVVNALNRVTGGSVAPATIVEVYGSDLASLTATPSTLPLPITANGTFFVVGPVQTPLFFLSNGQLDAQIPAELAPNKQYTTVVSSNGALTLPEPIDVVSLQPGVAATADGHVIAQHGADSSLVDSAHPAKPGEFLVIYLSGMGATNPSVASGTPSPAVEPLARLSPPPVVQIGGQEAQVVFAGLTPRLVGLYQINLQVPANAKPGDLDLVVKQGAVFSNTSKLPVSQ